MSFKQNEHPLWTAIKALENAKKSGAHSFIITSLEKRIADEANKSKKKLQLAGDALPIFDENGKTKDIK